MYIVSLSPSLSVYVEVFVCVCVCDIISCLKLHVLYSVLYHSICVCVCVIDLIILVNDIIIVYYSTSVTLRNSVCVCVTVYVCVCVCMGMRNRHCCMWYGTCGMGTFGVKYTEIYVPSMRYGNMKYENRGLRMWQFYDTRIDVLICT